MLDKHPSELRADLQRYYSIDLDQARAGAHTAAHVAALAACLPTGGAVHRAIKGQDAEWTLEAVMLANIYNLFAAYVYGMSDPRKRGARPKIIGPSWMMDNTRTLEARVLSIADLMAELNKPRR